MPSTAMRLVCKTKSRIAWGSTIRFSCQFIVITNLDCSPSLPLSRGKVRKALWSEFQAGIWDGLSAGPRHIRFQFPQDLFLHTIETAVGHDQNDIAGGRIACDVFRDILGFFNDARATVTRRAVNF